MATASTAFLARVCVFSQVVSAELVEGRELRPGLGELLDEVEVFDGDEQLVAVAVVELDELPALALDLDPLQAAEDADAVVGVDDIIAGLEVLELGEEGAARGPADDDLLLGEDVLFREEVELLLGVAEAGRERAEEEGDLVAGRHRERRLGLENGDIALAKERRQTLAGPGVQEIDGAEVALGLELFEVLEEEGDAVVEPRHGLEGEGEALFSRRRSAELFEADGLLADALEEPCRVDRVGVEGEDAVGEEIGELVAELPEMVVPFAIDDLGIVDDEDGIAEVIGHGNEAIGEEKGQGGEARPELAPLEGGDLGLEVASGALRTLAGGGLPDIEEFGRRRELAKAGDRQPLDPFERALAGDIEFAKGGDARAVELDAEGIGRPGREDVDDAAAPGEFARRRDEVLARVAVAGERFEEVVVVGLASDFEGEEKPAHVGGRGDGLEQAAERRDDDRGRRAEEAAEELHPRGHDVEGRRDLKVGVLGERGEGGQSGLGGEAGEEEAAVLLDLGKRGGFGADEDDGPAGRAGQAGEDVGLGRLDDAVDGKRPLGGGDGPDEVAEFGRAEKKIETHRAILTADRAAVKPGKNSRDWNIMTADVHRRLERGTVPSFEGQSRRGMIVFRPGVSVALLD